MSTLTKIFVVLLVVFCIAFSMTSIAFVARTHEWRDLATKYQQEAHIADTYVRNCLAESAAQKALDRDAINAHIGRINELETQQQQGARELAEAKAELAQTRAEGSSLQGIIRTLTGELKVGQAGWSEERKQREQLQQRNLDLERRNLDLNERGERADRAAHGAAAGAATSRAAGRHAADGQHRPCPGAGAFPADRF